MPLMDLDFVVMCQLVRHRMPLIRFLYIASYLCSTLLSDPASRRSPCASLSLHLHQVVKRTFTFELSNMLGTHRKGSGFPEPLLKIEILGLQRITSESLNVLRLEPFGALLDLEFHL